MNATTSTPGHLFQSLLFHFRDNQELPELFKKVEGLNDHRLLAIVTHLLMDNRLEKILRSYFDQYDHIKKFTDSQKLNVLAAANLIPSDVIAAARCVLRIRNAFAHNLKVTTFDDLPPETIADLKKCREQVGTPVPGETLDQIYHQVAFSSVVVLDIYEPSVSVWSRKVRSKKFIKELTDESHALMRDVFKALDELKPGEKRVIGDVVVEKFEGGRFTLGLRQP